MGTFIVAVLRTLWTFPTTAVGLFIGGVCTPLGARWQWVDGVLECHGGGVAWLLRHATLLPRGALAMTLGDVVLGVSKEALALTRDHERVHVRQAHRWGMFFIPAYFLFSLAAMVRGRDAYRGNAFEREAFAVSDVRDKE